MNKYRTHNCNELSISNNGEEIILSGWINKKRDHGNLLFIDLRDNYGITQCIIDKKLVDFIIKRIDRSYSKISDFIYKIDKISLKRKKPIDFKIIKEVLGE